MKKKAASKKTTASAASSKKVKIRLVDIADRAGVSVASVSRVIHGVTNIDAEIRHKVESAMVELKIDHDYFAKKSSDITQTQYILLYVQDILDPNYSSLIRGIGDIAHAHQFEIILIEARDEDKLVYQNIKTQFQNQDVKGMIYAPAKVSNFLIDNLIRDKIPLVVIGDNINNQQACCISTDIKNGAYDAAKYLISLGHRKILYISGDSQYFAENDKFNGYREALSDSGIIVEKELVVEANSDIQKVHDGVCDKINQEVEFSAIFCANDLMAFAAKQALEDNGLKVPDDISLMGFNELSLSAIISLTSCAWPNYEMGRNAMFMLIDLINKRISPPKKLILHPTMKIRNSCRRNNKYFEDTARSITASRIIRIGYTPPADTEFYDIIKHGAYTMMKELGDRFGVKFEFEIAAPSGHQAIASQMKIIENWIARKFDAILVCSAGDPSSMNAVFQKADENGTAIYMFNMPAEMWDKSQLKAVSVIGYNNHYQSGYLVGQYLAKKMNGNAKMLLIWGLPGHWSTARKEGFLEAIKPYPGLQIIGEKRGDYEFEKGKQVAFDLLRLHPDADLIYGENEEMAHGAVEAIEALNLKYWDGNSGIITIGADGLFSGYESIKNGKLTATVNVGPVDQGREFIMAVFMHEALGYSVDKIINVSTNVVDITNVETAAAYTGWALGTDWP